MPVLAVQNPPTYFRPQLKYQMDNSFKLSLELPNLPEPSHQMMEINQPALGMFSNLNDSLDIFNILKNEERCYRAECLNSKQLFPSVMRSIENGEKQRNDHQQMPCDTMSSFVQSYNQIDRDKIRHRLPQPLQITQVNSDSEQPIKEQSPMVQPVHLKKSENTLENLKKFLPPEMRDFITELPKQYLQALEQLDNQPQIKSDRRRRVERYLEKRRLKTWNKKICYNCRQKVAEQRLRVKGRFIGRKKAIEMLGIKGGRNLTEIRAMLENVEKPK